MAGLRGDTDVSTEEPVDIINDAGCHHGARASRPFFRRLEDQLDAAAEPILVIREPVRNTEADRGVGVVAAGVHLAFEGRGEAFTRGQMVRSGIRDLLNRERVHIVTEGERRTGAAGVENTDAACVAIHAAEELLRNTGLTGTGDGCFNRFRITPENRVRIHHFASEMNFKTEFGEFLRDDRGGFEFCPAKLRTLMNTAPGFDHFGYVAVKCICHLRVSFQLKFR